MAELKTRITLADIQRVVQQIVEQFHPQKVILFGSYAYGQLTQDSDVDFLVVMDTDENTLHAAARISASIDHPFPLDIIVRRPADLEAYLAENSNFEREVTTRGLTLHETED